jgi:hypothetical protein
VTLLAHLVARSGGPARDGGGTWKSSRCTIG